MKINREELHRLYLNKVNEVAEECDWITSFSIEDVVRLISLVIEQNPHVVQIDINPHDGSTLDNFLLEEENARLKKEIKQWQECADNLVDYAHEFVANLSTWGKGYNRYDKDIKQAEDAIEVFNRLKK